MQIGSRASKSRLIKTCVAWCVFVTTVTVTAQVPGHTPVPPVQTFRPEILGTHGIVAAGRHYSSPTSASAAKRRR